MYRHMCRLKRGRIYSVIGEIVFDCDSFLRISFFSFFFWYSWCQMRLSVCATQQHRSSFKTVFGSLLHCRPLLSEPGLGAALGCSPEPWQVSESLVRCWEGAECQAFDCLRISGLFSLHIKYGNSYTLILWRKSLCRGLVTESSGHIVSVVDVNKVFLI